MTHPASRSPYYQSWQPVLGEIIRAVEDHHTFLLTTHEHPDGDGLGSMLALHMALARQGKHATLLLPDPVPARYAFLPEVELVSTDVAGWEGAEVAVVVDCEGLARTGAVQPAVEACPLVINIDHHDNGEPFGDILLVDRAAPAAATLVHALFAVAGWELTSAVATCLYCAIGTDTGFFRFANTAPDALRLAAELAAAGADPNYIAAQAADRRVLPAARLLGRALASVEALHHDRVVLATLLRDDYISAGALPEHTEGVIDYVALVGWPTIAILMREEEPGRWRVSLRATDETDVAAVARRFGGGGHRAAAGCTLNGDQPTVKALLLEALEPALAAAPKVR